MPTRGAVQKVSTPARLTLQRPMITRRYELVFDHAKCCGCDICEVVCPKDAITLSQPEVVNGRVVTPPRVDVDAPKCCFCGECVVMCPTHAITLTVNGTEEVPVVKGEAFPLLIRTNKVNVAACQTVLDDYYAQNCPVRAINVEAERLNGSQRITAIKSVDVERSLCINCTRCMEEGPRGGFQVVKPYKGRGFINVLLCPPGCQACADICPTKTITYDGEKVTLDERYCLFCGACENVCLVPGAVRITRTGFVHTPVESGAWTVALGQLVSVQEASREHDVKGQDKRRNLVRSALLLEEVPKKYP